MTEGLVLWVIYYRPHDFPSNYVLRRQMPLPNGNVAIDPEFIVGPDLDAIHAMLPPDLVQIQRPGDDPDPHIIEVWV
jgi:hypothetical protein